MSEEEKKSNEEERLKIIITGDGACGKTVLLCAYIGKPLDSNYVPTVREQDTLLEIMDTAGQEDLDQIRKLAYPGTHCVVLCYSVVAGQTLNNVKNFWHPEIKDKIPDVPYILCGNKLDLKDEQPSLYLNNEKADEISAKVKNIKAHVQCSAQKEIEKDAAFAGMVNTVFANAIKEGIEYRTYGPDGGCGCTML